MLFQHKLFLFFSFRLNTEETKETKGDVDDRSEEKGVILSHPEVSSQTPLRLTTEKEGPVQVHESSGGVGLKARQKTDITLRSVGVAGAGLSVGRGYQTLVGQQKGITSTRVPGSHPDGGPPEEVSPAHVGPIPLPFLVGELVSQ